MSKPDSTGPGVRPREIVFALVPDHTFKPIVDVAFACGFVSAPHFSKCHRDRYGVPPREERRLGRPPAGVTAEERTAPSIPVNHDQILQRTSR